MSKAVHGGRLFDLVKELRRGPLENAAPQHSLIGLGCCVGSVKASRTARRRGPTGAGMSASVYSISRVDSPRAGALSQLALISLALRST